MARGLHKVHPVLTLVLFSVLTLAFGVTVYVLVQRLRAAQRKVHAEKFRGITLERQTATLRSQLDEVEANQRSLIRFLKDLPHAAHELHKEKRVRRIPALLLGFVERTLEPGGVLVLVRRRAADADPSREHRLVVAAASPRGAAVTLGAEITLGHGPIGFASEVQRVMDRRDFESQPPEVRATLKSQSFSGFVPDIVAPMVSGEETLGAIAVRGLKRHAVDPKDMLRVIAQTGALALIGLERLTEMTATASVDGLTRAFNKRFVMQRLAEGIRRSQDDGRGFAVFLFDIDHFKHYNDHNGHVAGDQVLRQLARLVQENIRRESLFGRFGGEEFILVLPGADKEKGLAAAENIRRLIAEHTFEHGAAQPLGRLSISGGVAACPEDASESGALLKAADEALYAAKRAGRNRVTGFVARYLGSDEAQEPVEPVQFEVPDEPEAPPLLRGEEAATRRLESEAHDPDETTPLGGLRPQK
jgi:diguanylate cyclase (GGDEF)-like protein